LFATSSVIFDFFFRVNETSFLRIPLLPLAECFIAGGGSGSFSWSNKEPRTQGYPNV